MRVVRPPKSIGRSPFRPSIDALADAFSRRHRRARSAITTKSSGEGRTGRFCSCRPGPALRRPTASSASRWCRSSPTTAPRTCRACSGTYLLMDGATGEPHAALDGTRLTVWRTAAASALAARYLARADTTRMVMVGAGSLAPFLIRAHMSQRPIDEVLLWNHRPERAEALAAELAARRPAGHGDVRISRRPCARPISSPAPPCRRQPLVRGEWLKPGAHLDLVGAFNLAMREADDEALQRSQIYVDTPGGQDPKAATWPWRSRAAPSPSRPCARRPVRPVRAARPSATPTPSRCSSPSARPWRILLRRCWCGAALGRLLRRISAQWTISSRSAGSRRPRPSTPPLSAGADLVGFVRFPKSPRHVVARDRPRPVGAGAGAGAAGRAAGRCRRRGASPRPSRRWIRTCCNCTAARRPSAWPTSASASDGPS